MTDEHGGKRRGAGRHPLSETEDVVTISFKVPISVKLAAEKLGEGNVSEGVRLLVEAGMEATRFKGLDDIILKTFDSLKEAN